MAVGSNSVNGPNDEGKGEKSSIMTAEFRRTTTRDTTKGHRVNFLSDAQWQCITDLILMVNSIENDPEFRRVILERLRMLIPFESAVFFLSDLSKRPPHNVHEWQVNPGFLDPVAIDVPANALHEYATKYYLHDTTAFADLRDLPSVFREESVAAPGYHDTAYFNDYLQGRNVVNCVFTNADGFLGAINLNRCPADGGFNDKELHILRILEPHVTNRLEMWHVAAGDDETETALAERFGISPREFDIIRCVTRGMSNTEIAGALDISSSTVKKHLESAFRKTRVTSRTELAILAKEHAH